MGEVPGRPNAGPWGLLLTDGQWKIPTTTDRDRRAARAGRAGDK